MGSTSYMKSHSRPKDFVSWFEIPVYDIQRATAFYNSVYNIQMEVSVNGEYAMAFFPADHGIGGALVAGPGCTPTDTGVLIYLNAGNDLEIVLGRVELAGGRVIMSRTLINEQSGYFAIFIDTEGNRLAFHEGSRRAVPAPAQPLQEGSAPIPISSASKKKNNKKR